MTNRRTGPRAARPMIVLAVVAFACTTLVSVTVAATPAGAATCNPLLQALKLCTMPPPAPTPSAYISMEDGLPADINLDPAYAPAFSIPTEPSTDEPSTPSRPAAPCGGAAPVAEDGTPWICTFSDEFTGSSLNRSKWTPQLTAQTSFTSGSGTATTCYVDSPDNISVGGGALALTVRKEAAPISCPIGGTRFRTSYTAGGVSTMGNFSQAYGRFDVRAAFPASVLRGLQSSLWLWPDNSLKYGPWPVSGEIDIAEYYTSRPGFVVPTLHYYATTERDPAKGINSTTDAFCHFDEPGKFHDYTLVWTPALLSVYYDGTLCLFDHWKPALMSAPAPFDSPFFLTLTAGIGIGANSYDAQRTELPSTTRVDYVRIYK
jgi:beta-glucanase (GH16 family)